MKKKKTKLVESNSCKVYEGVQQWIRAWIKDWKCNQGMIVFENEV